MNQPSESSPVREWSVGTATGAFLTGFAPGGTSLTEAHRGWLRTFAVRVRPLAGNLYIVGLVNRRAAYESSGRLAPRRAREVQRFLRSSTPTLPWLDVHVGATGDLPEGSEPARAAGERAVSVVHVAPGWNPVSWLREMVQERPQPGSIFYIRSVVLLSGEGARPRGEDGEGRDSEPGDAVVPDEGSGTLELRLEIADGRWSLLYRAFQERARGNREKGAAEAAEAHGLERAVLRGEGPWHTFRSPQDLLVQDFGGHLVSLISGSEAEEGYRLRLTRPPVVVSPFLTGLEAAEEAFFERLSEEPPTSGRRMEFEARLDAGGLRPVAHAIPPEIRAQLRRGLPPGPATREGDLIR